jgi:putative ABC transport system permease protein
MNLGVAVQIALRALLRNKERSLLTMLGIVIGVAAVIVTVAIGAGARANVAKQIAGLGSNLIIILPGSTQTSGANVGLGGASTLTLADGLAIAQEPHVTAVSPMVNLRTQVISEYGNWQTSIQGVAPTYPFIRSWTVQQGSFFTDTDVATSAKVCAIGTTIVTNLFPEGDAIGQTIEIRNVPFRVIGILQSKGHSAMGGDQDDVIMIPYSSAMQRLQSSNVASNVVNTILFSVDTQANMQPTLAAVQTLLRARHRIQPGMANDFNVRNTADIAQVAESTALTLQLLLAGVAAVSLVVGGIGIMNIMLVSVTERTREIGLRMAVGAPSRAILMQFLVESATLSSAGGLVGIALGVLGSIVASRLGNFPYTTSIPAIAAALIFSAAVGIFFGFSPARRAATLDPIVALRTE